MPLGDFGSTPSAGASLQDLLDMFARLQKEVNYLLNGGLDTLNVNELSADVINAGVLNAALVTVKAALTGLAYIQLAASGMKINDGTRDTFVADTAGKVTMTGATIKNTLTGAAFTQIDDTGIKINDGTKDTFVADTAGNVTMTGAKVQTAASGQRIEMSSINNLITAINTAGNTLKVYSNYSATAPSLEFSDPGGTAYLMKSANSISLNSDTTTDININSQKDLYLSASGATSRVIFQAWSRLNAGGRTLQQELDGKASSFTGFTGTLYVATTSGGAATRAINITNGVITS